MSKLFNTDYRMVVGTRRMIHTISEVTMGAKLYQGYLNSGQMSGTCEYCVLCCNAKTGLLTEMINS